MKTIAINPPPSNKCCEACGKHIMKLAEKKLIKNFRARLVGTDNEFIEASWECIDCFRKE